MSETSPAASTTLSAEPAAHAAGTGLVADFFQLTKARLSFLVVVTTFVGFCLASGTALDWERLLYTLLGTGLVAGAAAALNQVMEAPVDRLMERTRLRPLPSSRMSRMGALLVGAVMAVLGLLILALATTYMATYLAAATLFIYLAFYTPLKRRTPFCVTIGAVSGAIPPVIGWTAVDGSVSLGAWMLFGVLFAWQMPHFLALAWVYKEQYGQAGFVMLRRRDVSGIATATESLLYSIVLTAITLIPLQAGWAGTGYLVGALLCNLPLLGCAIYFLSSRSIRSARMLFIASIIYLPAILTLMMVLVRA